MNQSTYSNVSKFGCNTKSPVNNPLTYCMGDTLQSKFLHGSHAAGISPYGRSCQLFMSEYCAKKWDPFCELASRNTNSSYPNQVAHCGHNAATGLTSGEILIRNTAANKYLLRMLNGVKKYEPFDPTVPDSPLISYWVGGAGNCNCSGGPVVPEYVVNHAEIDSDPVMNKILAKPQIAMDILINIYNTMKRYNTLAKLKGTKLGNFYNNHPFFKHKGGVN